MLSKSALLEPDHFSAQLYTVPGSEHQGIGWYLPGYDHPRFRHGPFLDWERGSITADNNYPNATTISDAQSVHRDLPLNFFMDRYIESFIVEMKTFVQCVLEDKAPPVTGIDGRIPVVMGYAAKKSYEENRPVKLSEVDRV